MDKHWFTDSVDVAWLRQRYFAQADREIVVPKGTTLLQTGQLNKRLYLVKSGELRGYLVEGAEKYEIFRSAADMFVGVYSFFSDDHQSYSTVVATQDSVLCYLEPQDAIGTEFAAHFLPVLVHELKMRQALAQQMNREREAIMQRLFSQEKLTTLGQLAAGLAHELNNAIAMIERKTAFLAEWTQAYLPKHESAARVQAFATGLERGLEFGTKELRDARKALEARGVDREKAELLAGLGDFEGAQAKEAPAELEAQAALMEVGRSLHHIAVAAHHAAHVVTSVKELGVKRRLEAHPTDVNRTLRDALLLMRAKIGKVHVVEDMAELPPLLVSSGDLIQVWVNLVQNAAESLIGAGTPAPTVILKTRYVNAEIVVSVTDNGPGIPAEIRERIFEPNVTTKVSGLSFGMGLGLTIVSKIVEAYNGRITLESEPGKTVFTTFLPLKNGEIVHHQRG